MESATLANDKAVDYLLGQGNPAIHYWTLRDILGRSLNDTELVQARKHIVSWEPVADYLQEQNPEGYWGFEEDVYWPKWTASVWALILLAELGVPGSNPRIQTSCEYFLRTVGQQDRSWPPRKYDDDDPTGWRLCWEPCVTGNMARTLCEFGYGSDPRVQAMFEWLIRYQRDDGGWNCDTEDFRNGEPVRHSSFMSTIEPLWAFASLDRQQWPKGGREAVDRGIEFLLIHRLFKSDKTGKIIREEWTQLHFPMFYFYDILHGLRVITALGRGNDERTSDAIKLLKSKRTADGVWPMEASYLQAVRRNFVKDPATNQWGQDVDNTIEGSNVYTRGGRVAQIPAIYRSTGEPGHANPWVTLNALRVLKSME